MLADQLTKFVPGSKRIEAAMAAEEVDDTEEHSVCMVEAETAEDYYDGRTILVFAAIGGFTTLCVVCRSIYCLFGICCRRCQRQETLATAVAEVFPSAEQASYMQVASDDEISNTSAETIPASDTMFCRFNGPLCWGGFVVGKT